MPVAASLPQSWPQVSTVGLLPQKLLFSPAARVTETRQWIYHKWAMQLSREWPRDGNQYDTKHSAIDSYPWQSVLLSFHRKDWIIGLLEAPTFFDLLLGQRNIIKEPLFYKRGGSNEWSAEVTPAFISSSGGLSWDEGRRRGQISAALTLCFRKGLKFLVHSSRGPQWTTCSRDFFQQQVCALTSAGQSGVLWSLTRPEAQSSQSSPATPST